jgi:hypothetical protein
MLASSRVAPSTAVSTVRHGEICHWDLIPKQDVLLDRGDKKVRGRFLFRDTLHAVFEIGGNLQEFNLTDSGGLWRGARAWKILR